MSSIRYFYFFIFLSILFFISLQNDDKLIKCTRDPENVVQEFMKSFNAYKSVAKNNILYLYYGKRRHQYVNEHIDDDSIQLEVKYLVKKALESYTAQSKFCALLWQKCYDKSFKTVEKVSADYVKFATIENTNERETSNENGNENNKKQQITNMINGLPMFGCKIQEETDEYRFFVSFFEENYRNVKVNLHFFLFQSNVGYKEKPKNVKLSAYLFINYRNQYEKWEEKKKEILSEKCV